MSELMFGSVVYPSNTVEWALAETTNKPDVIHKAMEELDTVVGEREASPGIRHLQSQPSEIMHSRGLPLAPLLGCTPLHGKLSGTVEVLFSLARTTSAFANLMRYYI